jgi:hypothetical protein
MPEYTVKQGDCISSIAQKYGLFWEKIWDHSKNAQLKERRKDPNILQPGDVVFIPDNEEKEESGATEQRHRFRKRGVPAKLRLRLMEEPEREQTEQSAETSSAMPDSSGAFSEDPQMDDTPPQEEPRRNVPYVVEIDGKLIRGTTDDDGMIECGIPPNASKGRLIVEPGTPNETTLPLELGHLNPLSELSGIKQRLANLGLECGDRRDSPTPGLEEALRAFQEKHGLPVTGEADQTTRDKINEVHGS